MAAIKSVAVFGASGNFGSPITRALITAGFDVTAITRLDSTTAHPPDLHVVRSEYTVAALVAWLQHHDAVVCCVGPAGIALQSVMLDAAVAAGVRRFIIDDFGWGPGIRPLPEFEAIHRQRSQHWDHAKRQAEANPNFSWTGLSIGTPIDWALPKFPLMGFDLKGHSATIYDRGEERFTGTTLEGIGQAVMGIFQHLAETKNRFVKSRSIMTNQNELLHALETASGRKWDVANSTAEELLVRGREKHQAGQGSWILDLIVYQMYDPGQARYVLAATRQESDSELLGVREETALEIARKSLAV